MEIETNTWKRKRIETQKRIFKKIRKRILVGSVYSYIYNNNNFFEKIYN